MSLEQKDHLDYAQNGDTGIDDIDSIQPYEDGQAATQTTFRRPVENLRNRTEVTRSVTEDLLYYRDNTLLALETTGSVTWNGHTTGGGSGIINQAADITLRPFLTPATSTKGELDVGTDTVDRITYTVAAGYYSSDGANRIYVEHIDTGVASSHVVTISDGPVKRIVVSFDSANTAHDSPATKVLLDIAVAADSDLVGNLTITDNGVAANAIVALVETQLAGTADQEAHVIPAGLLDTFTTANTLDEGDTVAIWYKYVVEPAAGDPDDPKVGLAGGRSESNPDRATSTIPLASLFITSANPEKIPGAIPVLKVLGDELVWVDGTRMSKGFTGTFSQGTADVVNYTSGGTFISATNVQDALDEVQTDLEATGGTPGSSIIGLDNSSFSPLALTGAAGGGAGDAGDGVTTVQEALDNLDNQVVARRAYTAVFTDSVLSGGGDYAGIDGVDVLRVAGSPSNTFPAGGRFMLRRGSYQFTSGQDASWNGSPHHLIGETRGGLNLVNLTTPAAQATALTWTGKLENLNLKLGNLSAYWQSYNNLFSKCDIINCAFDSGSTVHSGSSWDCKGVSWSEGNAVSTRGSGHEITGNTTLGTTGTYTTCSFSTLPASAATQVANLNIHTITTAQSCYLVFEDCTVLQSYASGGSALIGLRLNAVDYVGGHVTFRDCNFLSLDSTITGYLVDIANCDTPIIFENCRFGAPNGKAISVDNAKVTFKDCNIECTTVGATAVDLISVSSGASVTFIDCTSFQETGSVLNVDDSTCIWERSTLTAGATDSITQNYMIDINDGASDLGDKVAFRNCQLNIGEANLQGTTTDPVLDWDNTLFLGIELIGTRITAPSGIPTASVNLLKMHRQSLSTASAYLRDVTFDLNDVAMNTGVNGFIDLAGDNEAPIYINNLNIEGVDNPDTSSGGGVVLLASCEIDRLNVVAAFTATYSGNYSGGIIRITNSTCTNVRIANADTFVTSGTGACMIKFTGSLSNTTIDGLDAGQSLARGVWYMSSTDSILDKAKLLNEAPNSSTDPIVYSASLRATITNCTFNVSTGHDLVITSSGDHANIMGNTLVTSNGSGARDLLTVTGDYGVVVGNVVYDTGAGTAAISDTGTGNSTANNTVG